jgi:UDP-N-acetylmuramyl pentapeptide phosphotransferase/UDP-N-acetylglucosamine-1-phosphate transferase
MIAILITFFVSMVVTFFVVRYEHLHAHVTADHDLDGIQKFHASPVPRVGGVSIMMAILIGMVVLFYTEPLVGRFGLLLMAAAFPVFIAGFVEDLTKKVSSLKRLFAAVISAWTAGLLLDAWLTSIDIPVIDALMSAGGVYGLVTVFGVAGVAHSFNIIDGFNGLSAVVALIILSAIAFIAEQVGDHSIAMVSCSAGAAILGFLIWNYPKGLIFLGDGGAYLIGFIVAELSVLLVVRNPEVSPWFPLVLSLYPVTETMFTIFRRVVLGRVHPGRPDAFHLHQLIYRRLVRSLVGASCLKTKALRNSMTSPFLWFLTLITVIPAIGYWSNTLVLQGITFLFVLMYLFIYSVLFNIKWVKRLLY